MTALIIRNTETERLAREFATATGQGITEAVQRTVQHGNELYDRQGLPR